MGAKIEAALNAVKPGSACNACVVVGGDDLNAIRAILGRKFSPSFGEPKGTLFITPGTQLYELACAELEAEKVRSIAYCSLFSNFHSNPIIFLTPGLLDF